VTETLTVWCPWCDAAVGQPCVNSATGTPYDPDDPHSTRVERWNAEQDRSQPITGGYPGVQS